MLLFPSLLVPVFLASQCSAFYIHASSPSINRWSPAAVNNGRRDSCWRQPSSSSRATLLQLVAAVSTPAERYDDQWSTMYERLKEYQSINGDCRVPASYSLDPQLRHWVKNQRAKYQNLSEERRQRLDDIGLVRPTLRKDWDLMFQLLVDYKLKHGDCCVPAKYQPDLQLGHWVMTQRANQYQNLSVERRQRLDDIGFALRTPRREWGLIFQRLVDYQLQHGDCRVPAKYQPDPQLARWVTNQRAKYQNLSVEQRQRLDDIGFVPGTRLTERWDSMFERLRNYQSINGHCAVPAKYSLDPQLGSWVVNQRSKYQTLSEERRQRLDGIGFVLRMPRREWDLNFQRLVDFQLKHGNCRVPARYQPDPQLGHWVTNQRINYPNLSVERRQRLDDIGFVLRTPRTARAVMFQRLVDYKLKHGDCHVPSRYQPDPQLARWAITQRINYPNLSEERRQRLDDIGFVPGTPTTERWDFMFERRRDYQSINGHCAVPAKYSLDPRLGHWVLNQRAHYQNLSEERRQRLDDIGFIARLRIRKTRAMMFHAPTASGP
jgi:Fe2+ transport system protein FeoA